MKAFEVNGTFKISETRWQKFTLQVASEDSNGAQEKVLTILGSRHKTPRRSIKIAEIREITGKAVTDAVVRHQAGIKS